MGGVTVLLAAAVPLVGVLAARICARARRRYVRMDVLAYRGDVATGADLEGMYEALHKALLERPPRRLACGQPSLALEVGLACGAEGARLAVCCPRRRARAVAAALRQAYPNARVEPARSPAPAPEHLLRLRQGWSLGARRAPDLDSGGSAAPAVDGLLIAMAAAGGETRLQVVLTPAPEWLAAVRRPEGARASIADPAAEAPPVTAPDARALFFADLRVLGPDRPSCEQVAAHLRARVTAVRLVVRGAALRHRLGLHRRRVDRGEGNPLPALLRGVRSSDELVELWQLPSPGFAAVPVARSAVPLAPAPPDIRRPDGPGLLRDALGPVTVAPELRYLNVAAPGAVGQGKTSLLVASVEEDLERERCAIVVLDPKGDAAEAVLGAVPPERTCTLLDLAHPTCGLEPLGLDAPADAIADYVVGALRHLFAEGDIRASSERYLRNAVLGALAFDPEATLWDAARLLSVSAEGEAFRERVVVRLRRLPELKEVTDFFATELPMQLQGARGPTTAKLDAPANKLARVLNSPSVKRVLLNDSLRIDLGRIVDRAEVLVVKGALGLMGPGNTAVVMQLIVGMLDATLAGRQDTVAASARTTVALKIDEAPLVVNRGFAHTLALKRSAGLETLACWQSDAQWTEEGVRDQLDALFAHRVYFATPSESEAAAAARVLAGAHAAGRPADRRVGPFAQADLRLHLPPHHAAVSWVTAGGRQSPFIARTLPVRCDPGLADHHRIAQERRGGRFLAEIHQPPWDDSDDHPWSGSPLIETDRADVDPGAAPGDRAEVPGDRDGPVPHDDRAGPVPDSLAELAALDAATRVRVQRSRATPAQLPAGRDLELLLAIAELEWALATQLHRHLCAGTDLTATQRRLKTLWEGGWVERFQTHGPDGGSAPMAYRLSEPAHEPLRAAGALQAASATPASTPAPAWTGGGRERPQDLVGGARPTLHGVGWALALARAAGARAASIGGPGRARRNPPPGPRGRSLGPQDLRLAGGRVPDGLLRTIPGEGRRVPLRAFGPVGPAAVAELRGAPSGAHGTTAAPAFDLLVEWVGRSSEVRQVALLETYDQFLGAWAEAVPRYRGSVVPVAAFVCPDADAAAALCARADGLLTAAHAYAGERPDRWRYRGRERILFVAEPDAHRGDLGGWAVPPVPPDARTGSADGRLRACRLPLGPDARAAVTPAALAIAPAALAVAPSEGPGAVDSGPGAA
jgi:hypothetical protein